MLVAQFGKEIQQRRKSLRITQTHLAELASISVNWISVFEHGTGNITLGALEKITEVLGLEIRLEVKNKMELTQTAS